METETCMCPFGGYAEGTHEEWCEHYDEDEIDIVDEETEFPMWPEFDDANWRMFSEELADAFKEGHAAFVVHLSDIEDQLYYHKFRPYLAESDDETYFCSCVAFDEHVEYGGQHDVELCKLYDHKGWGEGWCEWDSHIDAFVYFYDDATSLMSYSPYIDNGKKKTDTKATKKSDSKTSYSGNWGSDWKSTFGMSKCRHTLVPVEFPDRTVVYASSRLDSARPKDTRPSHGVYMDDFWFRDVAWTSDYLPWKDYGLPVLNRVEVLGIVDDIIERARHGQVVEVGCTGGHGRTGTLLALIASRCGVKPDEATEWVRTHYCKHAIESDSQEWYIEAFAAAANGELLPDKPAKPEPKKEEKKDEKKSDSKKPWDRSKSDGRYFPREQAKKLYDVDGFSSEVWVNNSWNIVTDAPNQSKCPSCGVLRNLEQRYGYHCWNLQCRLHNVDAGEPVTEEMLGLKNEKTGLIHKIGQVLGK